MTLVSGMTPKDLVDRYSALVVAHAELKAERDALREALRQITRLGVSFNAKGTRSKQVNDIARSALGRSE